MFIFFEDRLSPIKEKWTKSTEISCFEAGSDYSCYLNLFLIYTNLADFSIKSCLLNKNTLEYIYKEVIK